MYCAILERKIYSVLLLLLQKNYSCSCFFFSVRFYHHFIRFYFLLYYCRCWLLGTTPIGKQMLLFSMPFPNDLAPFKKLRIPCFGSTPLWNVTRESRRKQRGQHYGVVPLCVCLCVYICAHMGGKLFCARQL